MKSRCRKVSRHSSRITKAKGFFDVKVDSESKRLGSGDTITYRISRGEKRKVSQVSLSGNTQIPASELTSRIVVQKAHLFSPGNFSQKLATSSVKNLKAVYQAQGYSSVQVTSRVENRGPGIAVVFVVDEGPKRHRQLSQNRRRDLISGKRLCAERPSVRRGQTVFSDAGGRAIVQPLSPIT